MPALFLTACATAPRASSVRAAGVELSVRGVSAPEPHLEVTLTNRSGAALTTTRRDLPWDAAHSLLLIAARPSTQEPLMRLVGFDCDLDEVTLQPGETRSGTLALAPQFLDLLETLKHEDVVVFWSYQFEPSGKTLAFPRLSGAILLPRMKDGP